MLQTSISCLRAALIWGNPFQPQARVVELQTANISITGSDFSRYG